MTQRTELEHLLNVKTALAEKYERLASQRRSKPWKKRLFHRAEAYRQQAADLAEKLKQLAGGQ
jgi:hypothetical protein